MELTSYFTPLEEGNFSTCEISVIFDTKALCFTVSPPLCAEKSEV